jgi:hypothetical protein
MSKRRRKVDPEAVVKRMMRGQLKDFRKKFGRDPLPGEPVFFDPDKDVPTELTEERVRGEMMEIMSGGPPHLTYAYAKDGPHAHGRHGGVLRPEGRCGVQGGDRRVF